MQNNALSEPVEQSNEQGFRKKRKKLNHNNIINWQNNLTSLTVALPYKLHKVETNYQQAKQGRLPRFSAKAPNQYK